MKVRVSYGTAIAMGLIKAKMLSSPTTAYLMTYHNGRCLNDCKFCPQARSSKADIEKLSRITWPVFELEDVIKNFHRGNFSRICLQTVDYPELVEDVLKITEALSELGKPISISITPVSRGTLEELKSNGVDYIGIGLDAGSKEVYEKVKISRYSWDDMWKFLDETVRVFGKGRGVVHLIVGLGEKDIDLLRTIEEVYSRGGSVSLFAFTPIKGTALEKLSSPPIERYRKIQAAHYLIKAGRAKVEDFEFDDAGNLIRIPHKVPYTAFLTQGCPFCNRPYYNERPGRELYNYPSIEVLVEDMEKGRFTGV
ncbi:radical SAM protein [Pyrococcus furiosus DSM 3638]|uniref:Radical SAM protein n=3 Tax=Pyrococcus furiosus TaxID=2261 RepID=A0A5C0XPY9_PYRFU|nr:radical SAM protein [Pyrococcus furiosus]AAL80268.1 hypothetical protein PF0144 [Pyrococcus furiosus DSM 3638]AFN04432.1 hypothetical protein PFC_07480 [Pyrococcus furiosus COM1]QEK77874.1 radical SAM protein [Pyrococcus furiosus DSM 3638]